MKPQVRLLMLLTALLAAVTLVACGGGDESETADRSAQEILQETFNGGDGVESGVLDVGLDVDIEGQSATINLSGPFDAADSDDELPKFDFDLQISGEGAPGLDAGAISTGDAGFVTFQDEAYTLGDELFAQFREGYLQAQENADETDQPTLAALGIDPNNWITDPEKAGTEEVGGVETEHITAGVDVDKLLADLQSSAAQSAAAAGQELTDEDIAAVRDQVESAKVDVWTGTEDLRLRRLVVEITLKTGTATVNLEIADLDEEQTIEAPTDAKPIEELVAQLQSLFGGALPSTDPAQGSTGSGSGVLAPGADAQQKYLQCFQQAGDDIAAQQECAKFLGG